MTTNKAYNSVWMAPKNDTPFKFGEWDDDGAYIDECFEDEDAMLDKQYEKDHGFY